MADVTWPRPLVFCRTGYCQKCPVVVDEKRCPCPCHEETKA